MTRIERVRAALRGDEVDRPPFSVWYHFGLQFATPQRTAQTHLEFLEAYDLDWLKVMNDYSYPMPAGVETLSDAADLRRLQPFDLRQVPLGQQIEVIELLAPALRGRVHFVDTVFNAWNTLRRNIVKGAIDGFMRDHPRELEAALAVVNDNLIRYAQASLAAGASGIFLSVPATQELVTLEQYERFMRPYDLALLEAIRGRGEFHVLHAHGTRLHFDRLLDYPVHALSWGDRDGGPRLAEARKRTSLALMGGINHGPFPSTPAAAVHAEIASSVAEAGRRKLLVSPGCSIPTDSFPEIIKAARDAVSRA